VHDRLESTGIAGRKETSVRAVVYHGPGDRRFEDVPDPKVEAPTDVIARITSATICGTDLHILKGDVPEMKPGTILGHEAVGIIEEAGAAVSQFHKGDRVIIPAITACGICSYCRSQSYGQCLNGGGWIFGHLINGLHAEYARVPFADTSLHKVPQHLQDVDVLFLTDILATGYECGIVRGCVRAADAVAIVGAGPIGLSALLTSRFQGPRMTIMIDLDNNRLKLAKKFGADHVIDSSKEDVQKAITKLTGSGVEVAIEAVGIPETFELCTQLVRPGGHVANIGVHGKPVTLHLETLWIKNLTITTQLVDGYSIPMLLELIKIGKLDSKPLASHTFTFDQFSDAYDTFSRANETNACKVVIQTAR
jgi:alcohol dehydrogenase